MNVSRKLFSSWVLTVLAGLFCFGSLFAVALPFRALGFTIFLCSLAQSISYQVENKKMSKLRRENRTDDVTGLSNRRALMEKLDEIEGEDFALFLLDLDGFKRINDVLGHATGDKILQEVANRLEINTREEDFVARLGGDEFVVIIQEKLDAEKAAVRIYEKLCEEYSLKGINTHVGASIGIALSPRDGTRDDLLHFADDAMYRVKDMGGGIRFHDPRIDPRMEVTQFALMEDLRLALGKPDELVLHYQPICDESQPSTIVEALIRWQHPDHGLISPDNFIPLAEQAGMMQSVTWYVLRQAIRDCASFREQGICESVAVNLSASVLLTRNLKQIVIDELSAYNLPGDALHLELTENTIVSDPIKSQQVVDSLLDIGVKVMVDDYGTGYSSISHLRTLQVGGLKLDRSFITAMEEGSDTALAIVKSTIEMAHALDLEVVAEGVETAESMQTLRDLGVDYIQGYHISRPLPYDQLVTWHKGAQDAHNEQVIMKDELEARRAQKQLSSVPADGTVRDDTIASV